ncbi:class I SAM-dependent methyltransferase [Phormidesmis priestleyi]|uniref:class I SAM-dependent methyltransferase n=1 Tax=Phormidesmis priestleyi TaxID=268141 RepID=UPI000ACF1586|nr:class I SAM-dependent methyltransferase [Phormidesmis priestleyi]
MTQTRSKYVGGSAAGLATRLSLHIRQQMFRDVMKLAQPTPQTTVLDVGVTCDRRADSNFFERLYPYPQQLTAVGMEDASFLETLHPGITFIQTNGRSLPFPDQSFDLVVSFAVIEHVGAREQQTAFV